MKKFFIVIFLIFSSIALTPSYAEDKPLINTEDITLDQSTDDLLNRSILAFFGKDALQYFETRNISDLSDDINNDVNTLIKLSAPFPFIYPKIKYIFYILINASILGFLIYFSYLIYFGLFKSQNSGEFLGKSWSTLYVIIRVLLSSFLIFPLGGGESYKFSSETNIDNITDSLPSLTDNYYSTSQLLAFKIAGLSNNYGRDINEVLIDNQPRIYPSLGIPKNDSKLLEAKKITDYFLCIKSEPNTSQNFDIEINATESGLIATSINDICRFKMEFGLDLDGIKIAKESEFISSIVGDFKEAQLMIAIRNIKRILPLANKISSVLLSQSLNVQENKISRFNEFLKSGNNSSDIVPWEKNCEKIYNFSVPADNLLSEKESQQYAFMANRCLAYEINKDFILPNIDNISTFFKDTTILKERKIELCSQNYSNLNKDTHITTLIGDKVNVEESINSSFKYLSIEDCVKSSCKSLRNEFENSNLYSCSNSISLYKKVKEQDLMKKYGILTLGANIYTLFSSHSSESSKLVYNNIVTDFSKKSLLSFNNFDILNKEKTTSELKSQKMSFNVEKFKNFEDEYNKILDYEYNKIEIENFPTNEVSFLSVMFNWDSGGVFGSARLINCIKHPMTYVNGYSCGSVPEEYSIFGKGLIYSAFQYNAMKYILSMTNSTTYSKLNNKDKNGGKTGEQGEVKSPVQSLIKSASVYIVQMGVSSFLLDSLLGYNSKTDEFGNVSSKDIDAFQYNEELAAIAYSFFELKDSSLGGYIDAFFTLLLYLGVLFAFVIPFYPFFVALNLIFEWFLLLCNTLVIITLWSIYILKPSHNHQSKILYLGLDILLALFFKIPFMLIGLILGWVLVNTVITRVLLLFDFDSIMNISEAASLTGYFDSFAMVIIYAVLIFMITNIAIGVMESFYSFATDWIGKGSDFKGIGNSSDAKDKASDIQGVYKNSTSLGLKANRSVLSSFGR